MKLTIGMAQFDDFDGVYFTVQMLRNYHPELMGEIELLLINNSPGARSTPYIKNLIEDRARPGTAKVTYIEMDNLVGTSPTRQRIFEEASGDYVLCMDSHIMFVPGALQALLTYYAENPNTSDLISGPLVHDNMVQTQTHFDDNWRAEMWGTWGTAWTCKCGFQGLHFAVNERGELAYYRALSIGDVPVTQCYHCNVTLPELGYAGHEMILQQNGYRMLANQARPFEIPGQGLGVFTCRRKAWLGFNEHANKFGGEELYIHEKFRQAGHKAICLPNLKWVHRFARPNGVPYPLTRLGKIRNYVLEFNELGRPLDEIHAHFVTELGVMPQNEWDALVADPIELSEMAESGASCNTCGDSAKRTLLDGADSVSEVFDRASTVKRDLNQHLETIRDYARDAERVCEISNRIESAIAIVASGCKSLELHNTELSKGLPELVAMATAEVRDANSDEPPLIVEYDARPSREVAVIKKCDVLFIDSVHTYSTLLEELHKYSGVVGRYIIMHDTDVHGKIGEDGGPGLLNALREFMRLSPEWSVISHTNAQYGLTVIGCQKADKPAMPSLVTMATNLTKTMVKHVSTGAKHVSDDVLEARLNRCSWCEQRVDDRCAQCGCPIDKKAPLKVSECDLGRWEV